MRFAAASEWILAVESRHGVCVTHGVIKKDGQLVV